MAAIDVETAPRAEPVLAPVQPKDRIYNLDVLRGWAVLGILAVNAIVSSDGQAKLMALTARMPRTAQPRSTSRL